ncbi:MAG TPA: RluA family pseudouridine synthase [Paenalcaligenes sp.]|nr:RluA family pseudouridine synthase [Paenalcaligenes sp.]
MSVSQKYPTSDPIHEIQVAKGTPAQRLDKYLATALPDYSRARIQQWIHDEAVRLNGQPARPRARVQAGDHIQVQVQPSAQEQAFVPQDIPLDIVYVSEQVVVLNKAAGMVTHPGAGNWSGTLLNALLYHFPELEDVSRAGIVHRLDKDTSGLLMVARTADAREALVAQLKKRTVKRAYRAVCVGRTLAHGVIQTPIARDPRVAVRMCARDLPGARSARTDYQALRYGVIEQQHQVTEVKCRLHTGRTHQIRVHMSSQGHPLLGDGLYGGLNTPHTPRQMLHAFQLGFTAPDTHQELHFECPPPADYQALCEQIQWTPEEPFAKHTD